MVLFFYRGTETSRCSSDWPFQPYLVFDVGDGLERRDNEYVLLYTSVFTDGVRIFILILFIFKFKILFIQISLPSARAQSFSFSWIDKFIFLIIKLLISLCISVFQCFFLNCISWGLYYLTCDKHLSRSMLNSLLLLLSQL